ncbi:MAG: hypothetical protein AB6733_19780 [Clostridiaceae bacterium]
MLFINFIFAWKSYVMMQQPWMMPLFLFTLGLLLSTITWYRDYKLNHKKKNPRR